ncbi:uncharacterized protein K452DRAFT_86764 [Aplosporella prunicola CBS 121167]|uniref:Secreted protein n=1 Tax=Aplosporella prunicola CBS 121167 TaxID=1176127 RepID=A0A6A6B6M3_9PEZI|nr:uncharacterized protein K452DRAFT_86764 [Aplosporella prunicola CBS 121167]KAF2138441.1 hypothetical protein K452DRAFT_86764 [Aplosporella prunicola CBS 121167]
MRACNLLPFCLACSACACACACCLCACLCAFNARPSLAACELIARAHYHPSSLSLHFLLPLLPPLPLPQPIRDTSSLFLFYHDPRRTRRLPPVPGSTPASCRSTFCR